MIEKCIAEKEYKHVLGIATEACRLDKIEQILEIGINENLDLINYLFDISLNIITSRRFRSDVLRLIVKCYEKK